MTGLLLLPSVARAELTLPAGFQERAIVSGLDRPVAAAYAPDGRLFVAEKPGRVRVVTATGVLQSAPVIDLRSEVASYGDRGLLGLAVDANFASNRYLYLLHTYENNLSDRPGRKTSRLTRIEVSPLNAATNKTTLLGSVNGSGCPAAPSNTLDCIPSDSISHSIGSVRSAPDGTLWVGSGDGAEYSFADREALRTYNPESLAGKLLHIDRNGRGLTGHPYCPTDADLSHVCTKVAAIGFRNPFRFVLRDGKPLVGDVGWRTQEEIDLVEPGRNYGWP